MSEKQAEPRLLDKAAHTLEASAILEELNVDSETGLGDQCAKDTLARNGPNELRPPKKPSPVKVFLAQVANAMTIVLIAAMAVSFGTGDWIAGGVIAALVMMNVLVGFTQEWKAVKSISALESVGSPLATVIRHEGGGSKVQGRAIRLSTTDVVVGDIVAVKNGDVVPADARVLPGHLSNLECNEALLTGEALPVGKTVEPLDDPNCPVGDRTNMIFAGSTVTKGRARAVVVTTGMATELGKIAAALDSKAQSNKTGFARFRENVAVAMGISGTTPLQMKMNKLAYTILFFAVILAIIVVSSTGYSTIPDSIATYAVAAAVSLLPASLVAVVSMTLAVACRDLADRNALVRRMDAVETIGGVTDICSDKTGTITLGRMVLKKAWIPGDMNDKEDLGKSYSVETSADPYFPRGMICETEDDEHDHGDEDECDACIRELDPRLHDLVQSGALNNMATIHRGKGEKGYEADGDPTEIALQVFAHKAGLGKPFLTHAKTHGAPLKQMLTRDSTTNIGAPHVEVHGHFEMLVEHPFDSTVKRMCTVWEYLPIQGERQQHGEDLIVYMKGAVERVMERCTHVGMGPDRIELTERAKKTINERMDALASQGLRVLCLAGKYIPMSQKDGVKTMKRDELESSCGVLGLVGIYDPPRPESRGAVMDSHMAGIVPRMLTGDHAATARTIAISVGILPEGVKIPETAVMTGPQFDALSEAEIDALPELPVVVARCAPETKVRMVDALHRRGRKTVMTGDGVNDSPALKRADVGVAMGLNGSDVAKGAADMVLSDDNFSTIVRAIRKGRSVFQNLSKFLIYLLSGNVAEVIVLMIGLAFRTDGVAVYPLSPVAALWINTVAADPPALALGLEPTDKHTMEFGPENFQNMFTPSWFLDTIGYGTLMGAQTLANFVIVQYGVADGAVDIEPYCNDALVGLQNGCDIVFRARGTAFATLEIILMLHAITCKHVTKSIFSMNHLENRTLLWCVLSLILIVFPILYIPAIDDRVFQVKGLTWHWGLVFGQAILYLVLAELYKMARRAYVRSRPPKAEHPAVVEGRRRGVPLHMADTIASPSAV
ncbi:potassium/sodium eff [Schizophyllum amplum]|uniref:Potassium/sodium eff n=1 Tax=Schizophyllum amplum TaxID=97359 RepID=A0A550CJ16_9AGAR|nr:potassium/sodium eff [Auriculariopsis ampla]